MKTIIFVLCFFACAYSADYNGNYILKSTYDESTCCLPTTFTLSKGSSPYGFAAIIGSGDTCKSKGINGMTITGTATGASNVLSVLSGSDNLGDITIDSDDGTALFDGGSGCSATYELSGYLFGIGAFMILSFTYLFI